MALFSFERLTGTRGSIYFRFLSQGHVTPVSSFRMVCKCFQRGARKVGENPSAFTFQHSVSVFKSLRESWRRMNRYQTNP